MFALHVMSYLAGTAAALALVLSLASGLLYVAEIVEEHSKLAKVAGQRIIYAIIVLLVIFNLVDGLPLYLTALGIFSHLVYLQNFSKTWPSISLWSIPFVASCILVIISHFVSFQYWTERAKAPRHFAYYNSSTRSSSSWLSIPSSTPADDTFLDIATYFGLCVWCVPFFLFLSLSANDNILPSSGDKTRTGSLKNQTHQRKPSSMMKSALSTFLSAIPNPLSSNKKRLDDINSSLDSPSMMNNNSNYLQQQQQQDLYHLQQQQQQQQYQQSPQQSQPQNVVAQNFGTPSNYDSRFGSPHSNPNSPGLSPYTPLKSVRSNPNLQGGYISPSYNSPSYGSLQQQQQQQSSLSQSQSSQQPQYSPQNSSGLHLQMPTTMSRKNSQSNLNDSNNSDSGLLNRRKMT